MRDIMNEKGIVRLALLGAATFLSQSIELYKKWNTRFFPTYLPVIADIDDEWILTVYFLENMSNVHVEVMSEQGEIIYNEAIEEATASSHISILLTYEKTGDYQLSVFCEDNPLYVEMFELY